MPLDYENLQKVGAMVGSGGLVVMNEQTCMVQIARFFMQFTQNESCGKCVVCREGTKQMLALLDDIIEGRADETTIPLLEELAEAIRLGSLCGLGKTAPNPVLSTLKYFRDEYDAHVYKKYCPRGAARRWRGIPSWRRHARSAGCARANAPWARFPATGTRALRYIPTSASGAARAWRRAGLRRLKKVR